MRLFLISFFALCILLQANAQEAQETTTKKTYNIERTDNAPKIDGVLDDVVWQTAQVGTDFVEFRPTMGKTMPKEKRTEIKMTYDDSGIYIAAYLYDVKEDMMKQFTQRDNFGQSDFFAAIFNPNNDAQNNTEFFVFSSGTQADAVESPNNGEDFGWNAVWESAVKTNDNGWTVEMKIPYRALRFTQQDNPTWGIQFHRHHRLTREQSTWNAVDISKGNIGLYNGELKGLKNLVPPTRLNFYPFTSVIYDTYNSPEYNVGLDVKYGITENFTLDATLIPDFSQAGFDNVELNLGPFEQRFNEQRQFFTEGTDLFTKGDLFYSRRIGSRPTGDPDLGDNEEIVDYPNKVNMLNAVKVSGRTKNGLGIGFFNAITEKTNARIRDTISGRFRDQVVESLTNYNILVIDQQFNQNSSVSLINTNVTRNGSGFNSTIEVNGENVEVERNGTGYRDANVTGLLADISNKRNTYRIRGDVKMSNLNLEDGIQTGYSSFFAIQKSHGKFRYSFDHQLANTKYQINDLGLQFRNNFNNFGLDAWYQIFEPTKKHNNFNFNFWYNYRRLYDPNVFSGQNFGGNIFAVGKESLMAYGGNFNVQPGKQYDFFGPRQDGSFFISEDWVNMGAWLSSDYNKTFALDANIGYETLFEEGRTYQSVWFGIEPRLKIKDKFVMTHSFGWDQELRERGWIENVETTQIVNDEEIVETDIIYGQRDQLTIVNTISANYNFNSFHGLVLSFRNYWSAVQYENELFTLKENGRLTKEENILKTDIEDPDFNFSTWDLNLTYSWQFAPGSVLTAQYRNSIGNVNNDGAQPFGNSIKELFEQDNRNTFSLKMVYFIDYNNIKNVFKRNSKNI